MRYLLFFSLLALLVSCREEEEEKIDFYQKYSINYNWGERTTKVSAEIREHSPIGKLVTLEKEQLTVNKEIFLRKNSTYSLEFEGQEPTIDISFKDKYDRKYNNTYSLNDIKSIGFPLLFEVPLNNDLDISWFGYNPVSINEKVVLTIKNAQTDEIKTFEQTAVSINIFVPKDSLAFLKEGVHTMELKRIKTLPVESVSKAGGEAQLTYSTGEKSFFFSK
jgi:hypothetical protein